MKMTFDKKDQLNMEAPAPRKPKLDYFNDPDSSEGSQDDQDE